MIRRIGIVALIAVSLAGCGSSALDSLNFMKSSEKPVDPNLTPTNFKTEILRTVPSIVEDQTGIREAFYSDPMVDPKSTVSVYTSCVKFNARDSQKQYKGSKTYILYYYGGHLQQMVPAEQDQCRFAAYHPFPEVERLCVGRGCS
jgi:hypothetical protein